jgi:hypothetical protein
MQPIEFLSKVWGRVCEPGDYVFLSIKDPKWEDSYFKYDSTLKGRVRDWLRQHDPKKFDIYFCPLPFRHHERLAKYVKPVNILWSDVDDGDPKKLRPTVLWESSPGRHHALWFLKDKMHAEDAAELNRSVTYLLGADKGGWDLSQVLRVPGTYNHKYASLPQVKLLHWDKTELSNSLVSRKSKHKKIAPVKNEFESDSSILDKYPLSSKVKELLLGEAEEGRRSDVIWYLENKLNEAGMSPEEIISVIKASDWNKYAGRHDEDHRLKTELNKVIENQSDKVEKKKVAREEVHRALKLETFGEVMSNLVTTPGWQVEGFWMKHSHGIVAGEPKSFKSTLVMDLALSIATGEPFLGKYPVDKSGPVLYIQNENAHWIMKDRFEKMLKHKGVVGKIHRSKDKLNVTFPPAVPFYMINQQSFMLSNPEHQEYLEDLIKRMKPELVVLDPLYLMFDGDVASAQDLFPILQWLLYLKNTYNVGILVIHHYNKSGESKRGGQRMLGSTTLHGWIESAWYLTTLAAEGQAEVIMSREFRGAGLQSDLDIRIEMGDMEDPHYAIETSDYVKPEGDGKKVNPDRMKNEIIACINSRTGVNDGYIEMNTGYNNKQIRETVDLLIQQGLCNRRSGKIYNKETK